MEILGIALLIPLGGITVIALFAALTLLLPAPIEKTRRTLENALGRSLLLGVVNFIFFTILALGFFWISQNSGEILGGIFIFLSALIFLGLAILSLIGLTASANLLGERIGGEKTAFASHLRGGALLLLAALAPYVGWFLFTPLILWTGLGAAISALARKKKAAPTNQ